MPHIYVILDALGRAETLKLTHARDIPYQEILESLIGNTAAVSLMRDGDFLHKGDLQDILASFKAEIDRLEREARAKLIAKFKDPSCGQ